MTNNDRNGFVFFPVRKNISWSWFVSFPNSSWIPFSEPLLSKNSTTNLFERTVLKCSGDQNETRMQQGSSEFCSLRHLPLYLMQVYCHLLSMINPNKNIWELSARLMVLSFLVLTELDNWTNQLLLLVHTRCLWSHRSEMSFALLGIGFVLRFPGWWLIVHNCLAFATVQPNKTDTDIVLSMNLVWVTFVVSSPSTQRRGSMLFWQENDAVLNQFVALWLQLSLLQRCQFFMNGHFATQSWALGAALGTWYTVSRNSMGAMLTPWRGARWVTWWPGWIRARQCVVISSWRPLRGYYLKA